jgi:hypothetical protein
MFVRPTSAAAGNILVVDDMTLALDANRKLTLDSDTLGLSLVSAGALTLNTFTHIVLRFSGGTAYLFIDGAASGSEEMTADVSLSPTEARLGGFAGQLDEFLFKYSAGAGNPVIPQVPYTGKLDIKSVGGASDAKHGNATITTTSANINSYAIVSGISGTQVIIGTVTAGLYGSFEIGDEVMIHISLRHGSANAEADIGKYSIRKVIDVQSSILTIDRAIDEFSPDATNYVMQVIKIPNYGDFTLDEEATLIPPTWDNAKGGGMVALKAKNNCIINGKILTIGTGPMRTDTKSLTHADMIDQFICTGNIFIVAGNTIATGANAKLGGLWDGSLKAGTAPPPPSAFQSDQPSRGNSGGVGIGGRGGRNGGAAANGGRPGFGGKGGPGWNGSAEGNNVGGDGKSPPNVILIAKNVSVALSALAIGGGGGGATTPSFGGGMSGGGGGAFKGIGGEVRNYQGNLLTSTLGGAGADNTGIGESRADSYANADRPGGTPGGCGYGGGGGNHGQGGGGAGTGFCYIATAA